MAISQNSPTTFSFYWKTQRVENLLWRFERNFFFHFCTEKPEDIKVRIKCKKKLLMVVKVVNNVRFRLMML